MAEFCKECFKQLFTDDYEDSQIILSEDLDLCEGCADFKQVVVRIIDWIFTFTQKRLLGL